MREVDTTKEVEEEEKVEAVKMESLGNMHEN